MPRIQASDSSSILYWRYSFPWVEWRSHLLKYRNAETSKPCDHDGVIIHTKTWLLSDGHGAIPTRALKQYKANRPPTPEASPFGEYSSSIKLFLVPCLGAGKSRHLDMFFSFGDVRPHILLARCAKYDHSSWKKKPALLANYACISDSVQSHAWFKFQSCEICLWLQLKKAQWLSNQHRREPKYLLLGGLLHSQHC